MLCLQQKIDMVRQIAKTKSDMVQQSTKKVTRYYIGQANVSSISVQSFTEYYRVLQSITEYYRVVQSTTE